MDHQDHEDHEGRQGRQRPQGRAASIPVVITGERAALGALVGYVGIAFFLVVFKLGRYHWFFRDEWAFLAGRDGTTLDDIFRPHNEHWDSVGVVVFRALYSVFALRTYIPYQAVAVAVHLCLVLLLRATMRRAGVQSWLATAAAASFVLFGPGSQNIVSAFQIAFTGAVAFGLAQILLLDHDGPLGRRDALGVVAGAGALMCSGIALPMIVAAGAIALVRRGLTVAAVHTVPLAGVYGVWWLVYRPRTSVELFGRPSLRTLAEWIWSGELGAFAELGHYRPVAIALALLTIGGIGLAASRWRSPEPRSRLVVPIVLFLTGALVLALVAQGRWWTGTDGARINRYVYITVALSLPLIAVAADELARRWRALLPVTIAALLVAVPVNASDFEREPFGADYHTQQERIVRSLPSVAAITAVPPDTAPFGSSVSPFLTSGFLVQASRNGELLTPATPLTQRETDQLTVRLGVAAGPWTGDIGACEPLGDGVSLQPEIGRRFVITSPVRISYERDGVPSTPVVYNANFFDIEILTVQLADLPLRIESAPIAPAQLCEPA